LQEWFWIATIGQVLDFHVFAGRIKYPTVIRTGNVRLIALDGATQSRTPVGTGIQESFNFSGFCACQNHRLPPNISRHKIMRIGDLAFRGEKNPVALKNTLHFRRKNSFIVKSLAVHRKYAMTDIIQH